MRIGVSSYSFETYMRQSGCDYIKICDIAKEMGYEGIEFIDLDEKISGRAPLEAARAIREHCAAIGLEIIAYTVKADFINSDPEAEVARVCGCVDIAEALGAPVMRHDAAWHPAAPGRAGAWQATVAAVAPYIRRVAEYAAGKGIRTCTENHGHYLQEPERVEALIRAVDHPNYGWLVDIGNFICADCDSLRAVATAAPYATHVHAKDFLYKPGREPMPGEGWFDTRGGNHIRGTIVGHGVIPVPQCVATLRAAGYDGWLSYEFEGLEENLLALRAGLEYLKKIVNP